jgi:adenosylcobinamide kinase/adenosylcobinamide-phosphate guanylyltransferase
MAKVTFIIGGARSGKSRLAEELALRHGEPLLYIATGYAGDNEMAERIRRHQLRRGEAWQTIEEPLDIHSVLTGHDGWFRAVLLDCVTLWITNLMLKHDCDNDVLEVVQSTAAGFAELKTPLVVVSNEVGMGIVPDNSMARRFRDLAGEVNEMLAAASDDVYMMFSGLPMKIK